MPEHAAPQSTETVHQGVADLVEHLSCARAPAQVVRLSVRLVELIQHDGTATQEGIRAAGGVRSAVFLLKLSQAAGNHGIASAASRLLLHLARDNPGNQDEICSLACIPCLVDVALSLRLENTRPRSRSCSPGRELTEAVQSAVAALGVLAARHARPIARAGGIEASRRLSNLRASLQLRSHPAPHLPSVSVHILCTC